MYRGRYRHEPSVDTALSRLAHTAFGMPTMGPRELFYADMFASRKTPCRSQLGLPGRLRPALGLRGDVPGGERPLRLPAAVAARQRHALAQVRPVRPGRLDRRRRPPDRAHDGARGRTGAVAAGPRADRLLGPLAVQGRGRDRPLQGLRRLRAARRPALASRRRDRGLPELARRAGLHPGPRQAPHARPARRAHAAGAGGRGPRDADGRPPGRRGDRPRRARPRRQGGALRSARRPRRRPRRALERGGGPRPAGPEGRGRPRDLLDLPGRHEPRLVALRCPTSGEVLASGRPGYEFLDWGGAHHIGGGSHGSLHANDSNAVLLWAGWTRRSRRASSGRYATSSR